MCGHVGIFSNKILTGINLSKAKEFIKEALVVDTLRGGDGTGLFSIRRNFQESHIAKLPLEAHHAISHKYFTTTLADSDYGFMGHNRKSTRGINSLANTHPFNIGDIVLAHNGTLKNHNTLTLETYSVDSEAIAALLAKSHPKDAIEKLEGSYALVWYNTHFKTLSFARNEDRPLYIGTSKDKDLYFYASEYGIINWIAARNEIVVDKIIELPVGKIYTYHFTKEEKDWLEIVDFTPKKEVVVQSYKYQGNNYYKSQYFDDVDFEASCDLPQDRGSLLSLPNKKKESDLSKNPESVTKDINEFSIIGKNLEVKLTAFNPYVLDDYSKTSKGKANCRPYIQKTNKQNRLLGYSYVINGINRYTYYKLLNQNTYIECKVDGIDYKNQIVKLKIVAKKIHECSYCGTDIFNIEEYHSYLDSTTIVCNNCYEELTNIAS